MQNGGKLEVYNLKKSFIQGGDSEEILQGITQNFEAGKSYAIVGASGSGKSTFLHLLGGLDDPTSGVIQFQGRDLAALKKQEKELFLNQKIGFVFQFHYLINELTAFENVLIKGRIAGKTQRDCEQEALELFEYVGLVAKKDLYPGQLSGGEEQRVALVRALMNKPQLLLADEPTGNLDSENAEQVTQLLLRCHTTWGMTMIVCSHDARVSAAMQYQLHLHEGKLQKN